MPAHLAVEKVNAVNFRVQSPSNEKRWYSVLFNSTDGYAECNCSNWAITRNRERSRDYKAKIPDCKHIKAVKEYKEMTTPHQTWINALRDAIEDWNHGVLTDTELRARVSEWAVKEIPPTIVTQPNWPAWIADLRVFFDRASLLMSSSKGPESEATLDAMRALEDAESYLSFLENEPPTVITRIAKTVEELAAEIQKIFDNEASPEMKQRLGADIYAQLDRVKEEIKEAKKSGVPLETLQPVIDRVIEVTRDMLIRIFAMPEDDIAEAKLEFMSDGK